MARLAEGKYAEEANHIWSMLNDMCESDPSAYRKFVDKHIKEGKEYMAPPKPHMCVSTSKLVSIRYVTRMRLTQSNHINQINQTH